MTLQNRTTSDYFYWRKEDVYYLRLPGREIGGARSLQHLKQAQGECPAHHVVVERTTTGSGPADGLLGREITEWRVVP